jgi:formate dehydrogenase assembly factor FdhD
VGQAGMVGMRHPELLQHLARGLLITESLVARPSRRSKGSIRSALLA